MAIVLPFVTAQRAQVSQRPGRGTFPASLFFGRIVLLSRCLLDRASVTRCKPPQTRCGQPFVDASDGLMRAGEAHHCGADSFPGGLRGRGRKRGKSGQTGDAKVIYLKHLLVDTTWGHVPVQSGEGNLQEHNLEVRPWQLLVDTKRPHRGPSMGSQKGGPGISTQNARKTYL